MTTVLPAPPLVHHEHPARWRQDVTAVPRQRTYGADEGDRAGAGVVYGSFTCPWSYLASQRTDRIADPRLRPTWRMIDPDDAPGTRLSAPGCRLDAADTVNAAEELDAVRPLLLPGEHLPARPPAFVPHTGPAVVGYAEAVGAGVDDQVRRLLFDAYWRQGLDIGLPDVLRRILQEPLRAGCSDVRCVAEHGYAVTLTGGPVTTAAHRLALAWHEGWLAASVRRLPVRIVDAGTTCASTALAALICSSHHVAAA